MGLMQQFMLNEAEIPKIVMVLSVFLSSLIYLIPLLILTFGSKAEFVSRRE